MGFTDPVALHELDLLRPIDAVEVGDEAVAVLGDAHRHWRSSRWKTGKLPRSDLPSAVTSSLASTVPRPGHQLTGDLEMYARRKSFKISCCSAAVRSDHCLHRTRGQEWPFRRTRIWRRARRWGARIPWSRTGWWPPRRTRNRRCARRSTGPTHVAGVGGGERAAVVEAQAHAVQLAAHVGDVRSVVTRGCWPVWTAYCSAGRPKAS